MLATVNLAPCLCWKRHVPSSPHEPIRLLHSNTAPNTESEYCGVHNIEKHLRLLITEIMQAYRRRGLKHRSLGELKPGLCTHHEPLKHSQAVAFLSLATSPAVGNGNPHSLIKNLTSSFFALAWPDDVKNTTLYRSPSNASTS